MNYRHVLTAAALCTIALGTVSAQQGEKKAPAAVQQAKPDSAKKDAKKGTKGKKKGAMKKDSTKAPAKKP